jgi:hypothetical protein
MKVGWMRRREGRGTRSSSEKLRNLIGKEMRRGGLNSRLKTCQSKSTLNSLAEQLSNYLRISMPFMTMKLKLISKKAKQLWM